MQTTNIALSKVVTRAAWLVARQELLTKERRRNSPVAGTR